MSITLITRLGLAAALSFGARLAPTTPTTPHTLDQPKRITPLDANQHYVLFCATTLLEAQRKAAKPMTHKSCEELPNLGGKPAGVSRSVVALGRGNSVQIDALLSGGKHYAFDGNTVVFAPVQLPNDPGVPTVEMLSSEGCHDFWFFTRCCHSGYCCTWYGNGGPHCA